jgi:hypothetical protein
MKLPFQEPEEWRPREHLGVDLSTFTPFERQVLSHFDVAVQQIEFLRLRTRIQWVLIGVLFVGFGVLAVVRWPALIPVLKKIAE